MGAGLVEQRLDLAPHQRLVGQRDLLRRRLPARRRQQADVGAAGPAPRRSPQAGRGASAPSGKRRAPRPARRRRRRRARRPGRRAPSRSAARSRCDSGSSTCTTCHSRQVPQPVSVSARQRWGDSRSMPSACLWAQSSSAFLASSRSWNSWRRRSGRTSLPSGRARSRRLPRAGVGPAGPRSGGRSAPRSAARRGRWGRCCPGGEGAPRRPVSQGVEAGTAAGTGGAASFPPPSWVCRASRASRSSAAWSQATSGPVLEGPGRRLVAACREPSHHLADAVERQADGEHERRADPLALGRHRFDEGEPLEIERGRAARREAARRARRGGSPAPPRPAGERRASRAATAGRADARSSRPDARASWR